MNAFEHFSILISKLASCWLQKIAWNVSRRSKNKTGGIRKNESETADYGVVAMLE